MRITIISILGLTAAAGLTLYYLIFRPLPQADGKIALPGLQKPVRILRDQWGLPHIYAENLEDLLFAQGFVHAQDRLWQMELRRRLAAGRMSEIFGKEAVNSDRLVRTLGLMDCARRELSSYDETDQALLLSYCRGINAFLEHRGGNPPVEFHIAGIKPEKWAPEDSLAVAKFTAFFGSKNWQEEIVRGLLAAKLGPRKALRLMGLNQPNLKDLQTLKDSALILPEKKVYRDYIFSAPSSASNSWVVSGAKSETGLPLLANDIHLPIGTPSPWYEIHLSGGGLNVIGLSTPGLPYVIAGHNNDLAWGVASALIDNQDLFLEKINPNKRGQYLFKKKWLDAVKKRGFIKVKGTPKPVIHEYWITRHGPIIQPVVPEARSLKRAVALKWSGFEPGETMSALRRINSARNIPELKSAAAKWAEPGITITYAHKNGQIGYLTAGRIPVRQGGHGLGPFPGWSGRYEWKGYISPEEKPARSNPANGFLIAANQRPARAGNRPYLSTDYAPGYRAARINQVLSEKQVLASGDMTKLQNDVYDAAADLLIKSLEKLELTDPEAMNLQVRLLNWDRNMSIQSPEGSIYMVLCSRLMENIFRDDLGIVTDYFFGKGLTSLTPLNQFALHSRVVMLRLLEQPDSDWHDDINTPARENLILLMERSLLETKSFLTERFGENPDNWQWGRLHQVHLNHSLVKTGPFKSLFNSGPFMGRGSFTTVLQSTSSPGLDFKQKGQAASNRHLYDLSDWDQSLGCIVPGQSGQAASKRYRDQVLSWFSSGYHMLAFSEEQVRQNEDHTLSLEPE